MNLKKRYRTRDRQVVREFKGKRHDFPFSWVFLPETENLKKDGKEFPVELLISLIPVKGQWHSLCLIREITHWRQALEDLP